MKSITITAVLCLLGACTEPALEPTGPEDIAAAAAPQPGCTKTWIDPAGGAWLDDTNWAPAGVPTLYDVACLVVAGTYAVTIDSTVSVGSIVVGGPGAAVTLVLTGLLDNTMGIGDEVIVNPNSEFAFVGTGFDVYIGGAITNFGTIRVTEGCACAWAGAFRLHNSFATPTHVNHGLLDLSDAARIWLDPGVTFVNYGDITVTSAHPAGIVVNSDTSAIGASIEIRGGRLTGTQALAIDGAWPWSNVDQRSFIWSGGTIGTITGDPTRAILSISELPITLKNTTLSGRLDLEGSAGWDTIQVTGDIGPGVHLRILGHLDQAVKFTGVPGPITNAGRIDVARDGFLTTRFGLSFPSLRNVGVITFTDADVVDIELDSLVNTGIIAGNSDLRLATSRSILRNRGTVALRGGAALTVPLLTTFHSAARSSMTGTLALKGGTLEGTGALGRVIVSDGTIRPGLPIGTLTASTLLLGPKAAVAIDVAGTNHGEYDHIEVSGEVTYGGTLAVTSVAPFSGGLCGQVIPIITDSATAPRGTFSKLVGLVQGPTRQWRLDMSPNILQLAGFNPIPNVFAKPDSVTATEGGASGQYAVCLGQHAPTADVVVSMTRGGNQIEVIPGARTFTPSNWMLPQFVSIVAINDAIVEGDHADVVHHAITSADRVYSSSFLRQVDVRIIDNDMAALPLQGGTAPRSKLQGAGRTSSDSVLQSVTNRAANMDQGDPGPHIRWRE